MQLEKATTVKHREGTEGRMNAGHYLVLRLLAGHYYLSLWAIMVQLAAEVYLRFVRQNVRLDYRLRKWGTCN